MIISFILMTSMLALGVILMGDNSYESLLLVKELIKGTLGKISLVSCEKCSLVMMIIGLLLSNLYTAGAAKKRITKFDVMWSLLLELLTVDTRRHSHTVRVRSIDLKVLQKPNRNDYARFQLNTLRTLNKPRRRQQQGLDKTKDLMGTTVSTRAF